MDFKKMNKRGKTSESQTEFENELATIAFSPIDSTERPSPPRDFDKRESNIWITIVNSMPADWFNIGSIPLLTQYVRHTVASQNIAALISHVTATTEETDINAYIKLLRAQKEESGILSSLATKLRISNQSLINKRGNHKTVEKKPWE